MTRTTSDPYEPCELGHSWVAGMMYVHPDDVESIAELREGAGLSRVECERCETRYYPIAKEGTLPPEPTEEPKPITEWVERLKRAGFPVRYADKEDLDEYRSISPYRLTEYDGDNSVAIVDLCSVAAGEDHYDQVDTVRRSNYRVLWGEDEAREENNDPRRFIRIAYRNVDHLGAVIEDLEPDDIDTLIYIKEESPVLDESDLSDLENEEITESWDQWLSMDVERELSLMAIDDMPRDSLDNPPWYVLWDGLNESEKREAWWEAYTERLDAYPEHTGTEVTWPDWHRSDMPEHSGTHALRALLINRVNNPAPLPGQDPLPIDTAE